MGVYHGSLLWRLSQSLPWELTMGVYCGSLPWEGLDQIRSITIDCGGGTFFIYHKLPLGTIDLVGDNSEF